MKHDTITYTFRHIVTEGSYRSANKQVELCESRLSKFFIYPKGIKKLYVTISKVRPEDGDYLEIYPDEDGFWGEICLRKGGYTSESLYWSTARWLNEKLSGVKKAYVWVEYDQ